MSKYWNSLTKRLDPYIPGEQPRDQQYIKLNTNENPYPPSPAVLQAISKAANADLRLYPDPEASELRQVISDYYRLPSSHLFIGNGSDEILSFAFAAFFEPGARILFPDITYSFYPVYAGFYQLDYQLVALDEEFTIPYRQFGQPNQGIILPNPNAPTGKYLPLPYIQEIVSHNPEQVVIIDEAYIDFGGESAVSLIEEFPNLLVIQTLSKSRSLAGLRLGYALGQPDLISGLERVKNSINSYTIDRLALAGGRAAFLDEAYFKMTREKISQTRAAVSLQLKELGFQVIESLANFIFISHPHFQASELYHQLKERGILVRYFNKPRIKNYLRVSIGTDAEMASFLKAVRELLK